MPTIPVLESKSRNQVLSARRKIIQGPQTVTDDAGAIAEVGGILKDASAFYLNERAKADATKKDEIETTLIREKNRLLTSDNGYYKQLQSKAGETFNQYRDDYDKIVETTLKGVEGSRIADDVKKMGERYKLSYNEQLQGHLSKQMESYHDSTFENWLSAKNDQAALDYKDFINGERVSAIEKEQSDKIEEYGNRKGFDSAQKQALKTSAASDLYSGVIGRMLQNREDILAKNVYEGVKDKLDAKTQLKLSKAIEDSYLDNESRRQADSLYSKYNGDLELAMKEARKIQDTKIMDDTKKRLQIMESEDRAFKRQAYESEFDIASKNFSNYDFQSKTYRDLDANAQKDIRSWVEKLRDEQIGINSGKRKGNTELFYKLSSLPTSEFEDMDLRTYIDKLPSKEYLELNNLQKKLLSETESDQNYARGVLSDSQMLDAELNTAGLSKSKRPLFKTMFNQRAWEWKQENKKNKIPQDEQKKIIDSLLTVQKNEWYQFGTTRAFEKVNQIPAKDLREIRDALKEKGLPYTDAKAIELYNRQMERENGK